MIITTKNTKRIKNMRENRRNPLDEIPSGRMRVIELDNGDYYYLNYENGKLQAGHTTNNGFYPEYEIEYDWDFSLDHNIESLYDKIEDNSRFESVSKSRKKARRVESMRIGTRARVRKPIKEATDDIIVFEQVPRDEVDWSIWEDDFPLILEDAKAAINYDRTVSGYDKVVDIIKECSYCSSEEICQEIEEQLGVPYEYDILRGVVQREVATVYYPRGRVDNKTLNLWESIFFRLMYEFHNVTEDLWGYFFPYDYTKDQIRKELARNEGVSPDKIKLRMITGSHTHTAYDYDESYRKVRKPIRKESMGSHLAEYQKWVDYDMERYGRISDRTMDTIRKAGLSVVKDQYGEYEVIAYDRKESLNRKRIRESAKHRYGDTTLEDYIDLNFYGDREDKHLLLMDVLRNQPRQSTYFGINMSVNDWKDLGRKYGLTMKSYPVNEKNF